MAKNTSRRNTSATQADAAAMPARRCIARRTDGKPCRAAAAAGRDYCLWHDPERGDEQARARYKGGKAKAGRDLSPSDDADNRITLATPADALAILERGMNDLFKLENSVSRARAVFAGVAAFAKLYETSVQEARLNAVEEWIKQVVSEKTH